MIDLVSIISSCMIPIPNVREVEVRSFSDAIPALQRFNGRSDSVDAFLQQANDVLALLSSEFESERQLQRVVFVAIRFDDSTLGWYHGLQNTSSACFDSLDSFISAFHSRFGNPDPSFTAYRKLKTTYPSDPFVDCFNELLKHVNITVLTATDFYCEAFAPKSSQSWLADPDPSPFRLFSKGLSRSTTTADATVTDIRLPHYPLSISPPMAFASLFDLDSPRRGISHTAYFAKLEGWRDDFRRSLPPWFSRS